MYLCRVGGASRVSSIKVHTCRHWQEATSSVLQYSLPLPRDCPSRPESRHTNTFLNVPSKQQAPASWKIKYIIICKSIHQPPLVQPSESTIQRKLLLYCLKLRAADLVRLRSLACFETLETSLSNPNSVSFCGLFDIHHTLSSPGIHFSPSPTPPSHYTPIPCETWKLFRGALTTTKGRASSPRLIPHGVSEGERWSNDAVWPSGWCVKMLLLFFLHSHLEVSLTGQTQAFPLPWLQESFQPCLFHFFKTAFQEQQNPEV